MPDDDDDLSEDEQQALRQISEDSDTLIFNLTAARLENLGFIEQIDGSLRLTRRGLERLAQFGEK